MCALRAVIDMLTLSGPAVPSGIEPYVSEYAGQRDSERLTAAL